MSGKGFLSDLYERVFVTVVSSHSHTKGSSGMVFEGLRTRTVPRVGVVDHRSRGPFDKTRNQEGRDSGLAVRR